MIFFFFFFFFGKPTCSKCALLSAPKRTKRNQCWWHGFPGFTLQHKAGCCWHRQFENLPAFQQTWRSSIVNSICSSNSSLQHISIHSPLESSTALLLSSYKAQEAYGPNWLKLTASKSWFDFQITGKKNLGHFYEKSVESSLCNGVGRKTSRSPLRNDRLPHYPFLLHWVNIIQINGIFNNTNRNAGRFYNSQVIHKEDKNEREL